METDGTQVTRLSLSGHYDFLPRWSPDAKRTWFTSFRAVSGVYTMMTNGTEVRHVSEPDFLRAWAR